MLWFSDNLRQKTSIKILSKNNEKEPAMEKRKDHEQLKMRKI